MTRDKAFTLIELLVVIAIVAVLAAILFPVFASAKLAARRSACMTGMRQLGVSAWLYMQDNDGGMYHHHEDWVLNDGTLTKDLPATVAECAGGGYGNSQAEKPWAIFLQPYIKSRTLLFCPDDSATRSVKPATSISEYNGGVQVLGSECSAAPEGEQCVAERRNLSMWSYALNSIFTHKSCRYAMEGALSGYATESVLAGLTNPNVILFSERNSEGLVDPNSAFYYVPQDDYDTWAGEAALVRWGSGDRPTEGWLKPDRHNGGSNYVYADIHARWGKWSQVRADQYPDHVVRQPLQ